MSFFPSRILLATDGSGDADLAAETAVEISNETGSELYVVHVGPPTVPTPYAFTKDQTREARSRAQGGFRGPGRED